MDRNWIKWIGSIGLAVLVGCGYSLQGTNNPLEAQYGVRTVYIAPLVNNTYKSGVENLIYNELVRSVSANRKLKVVNTDADADAVLSGIVIEATYLHGGGTTSNGLYPTKDKFPWVARPPGDLVMSTEYTASLQCSFSLSLVDPHEKKAEIWNSRFSRTHPFPANNQIGTFGTTSALINESEFDRALSDMARSMMDDVTESLLAQF